MLDIKMYYFAMPFGIVLGTWVGSWIFALSMMNFGMVMIIFEVILEKKYGRN